MVGGAGVDLPSLAVTPLDAAAAAGAGLAAGVINAVAGGGTLVSFPILVALGVPAVAANATNTVALCPGYLGGSWAQRVEVADQARRLARLVVAGVVGGVGGAVLLLVTSETVFRSLVPWLILAACGLLVAQEPIKRHLARAAGPGVGVPGGADGSGGSGSLPATPVAIGAVLLCALYGGYFGAGLGIMMLAALGLLYDEPLVRLNAVKQTLSLVINSAAAMYFAATGRVVWSYVVVMAVASLVGGHIGGKLVGHLRAGIMRALVVVVGVAVAIRFLV